MPDHCVCSVLYKEDFCFLQDSLQTAAAHHKVLESQLTDSVSIVEALSNNNLRCDGITGTALLVSNLHNLMVLDSALDRKCSYLYESLFTDINGHRSHSYYFFPLNSFEGLQCFVYLETL